MQPMRDALRGALARSLGRLCEEDRLAAALPLVCGSVLAGHCQIAALDEAGRLHLEVDDAEWMSPLLGMRQVLQHDLARVAGVALTAVHFHEAGRSARAVPTQDLRQKGVSALSDRSTTFLPKGRLA